MDGNGTERTCGDCTLCCFTHSVRTLNNGVFKNAYTWCQHCRVGHGCENYGVRRPFACLDFECGWLQGMGEEDERPDKTQIVLVWKAALFGRTLTMVGAIAGAFKSEYARTITAQYLREHIPVVHVYPDRRAQLMLRRDTPLTASLRCQAEEENVDFDFVDID